MCSAIVVQVKACNLSWPTFVTIFTTSPRCLPRNPRIQRSDGSFLLNGMIELREDGRFLQMCDVSLQKLVTESGVFFAQMLVQH